MSRESRRVIYANCFVPASVRGEVLLTDEPAVAATVSAGVRRHGGEDAVDPELSHRLSVELGDLALSWFRSGADDPTIVDGLSAGDLAASEAGTAVLGPAVRGALAMAAALERGLEVQTLVTVVPAARRGWSRYRRFELLAAQAATAVAQARLGARLRIEWAVSEDARNELLRNKYALTRDPEILFPPRGARMRGQRALIAALNAAALIRSHNRLSLGVVEYNPTLAFSRCYAAGGADRRRLVRWINDPRELLSVARHGDMAALAPAPRLTRRPAGVDERLRACGNALAGARLQVAGTELWPLVRPHLIELSERYGRYVAAVAPGLRRQLTRRRVEALLVPFDLPPAVRLLVRVAQELDIPTFVINEGYKADEIQHEGFAADTALAWSEALRDGYFARRPDGVVVAGNPRRSREQPSAWRAPGSHPLRVLVGSFTFSPIDLNCRRSDAERFLEQVLAGIAAARPAVAREVVVKLHPADAEDHYGALQQKHPNLDVRLVSHGDVVEQLADADVYVTTYSTSLLEAAGTMPVIYFRVNEQRLMAPFSDDPYLAARTAASEAELTRLLADRETLSQSPPNGWIERYLGPTAGATDRIVAQIEAAIAGGSG